MSNNGTLYVYTFRTVNDEDEELFKSENIVEYDERIENVNKNKPINDSSLDEENLGNKENTNLIIKKNGNKFYACLCI